MGIQLEDVCQGALDESGWPGYEWRRLCSESLHNFECNATNKELITVILGNVLKRSYPNF